MSAPGPSLVPAASPAPSGGAGWGVIAAGLVLAVVLALRLAGLAFNGALSSDALYSQVFAADLLAGRYPSSGWSFCGAPYFFPDVLAYGWVLASMGLGGIGLAFYVAGYAVAWVVLVAACARWWAGCRPLVAWLAGVLVVNAALLLQFLPQHVPVLWLLPQPNFHGGALLTGLALVALAGRIIGEPPSSRRILALTGAVLGLGLLSDSLLLVQFVMPLGTVIWWLERRGGARPGSARCWTALGGFALGGVALTRFGMWLADWGYYYA
ncbi:MAG: hypothetical protein WCL04_02075, partial [Verrucomicrobiota bacterium]